MVLGTAITCSFVSCQGVLVLETKMKTFLWVLVAPTGLSSGSVTFCGSWDSCLGLILETKLVLSFRSLNLLSGLLMWPHSSC